MEQAENERTRAEIERQRALEEEAALEKATPSPALREREELRRLEQEKRRREARASCIDINRQSMSEFEGRERLRALEEEAALERSRRTSQQQHIETSVSNEREERHSPPNAASADSEVAIPSPALREREELKRLEQEKRRREAHANYIDMDRQSDIMSTFEENL